MLRVCLVSRAIDVASGGGIGAYVSSLAQLLSRSHEVTVITSDANADRLPSVFPDQGRNLRTILIPEPGPEDEGSFNNLLHLWSHRVYEALIKEFPGGGPNLVEFPDYLGEGAVTTQAKRTRDPALQNTVVGVRIYTTAEICSVLNGSISDDFATRTVFDLERYALANADYLVHAGGDLIGTYARFYGARNLSPPFRARHPATVSGELDEHAGRLSDGPLRLLYMGRLERRKGVQNMVRALSGLPSEGWRLTLVGGDTDTAPLGMSMRDLLELMASGDDRIEIKDGVAHSQVPSILEESDIVVQPSLWECWPNIVLEALAYNRPVIATPVGGMVEMVRDGVSGFLAPGTSPGDLSAVVERAAAERDTLNSMVEERQPLARFRELSNPEQIQDGYERLATSPLRFTTSQRPGWRKRDPLLSVVIPYYQLDDFVEETVASVFSQSYRRIEVIVVNDGSFRREDRCLARLATRYPIHVVTQLNSGLSAARNLGISQSRGKYVLPVDADNMIEPAFISRCVDVLEADPEVSYVTSWTRYIDERGNELPDPGGGYQPIGNSTDGIHRNNIAGDAIAVFRRRVFDEGFWYHSDLTSYEDWLHYRRLHAAGHFGHAIPERLIRYRVRSDSMLREVGQPLLGRLVDEMAAHFKEEVMTWEYGSA